MRNFKESAVEEYRYQSNGMESPAGAQYGTFVVPLGAKPGAKFQALAVCLADDGGITGWERVTIEMREKRRAHLTVRAPRLDELATIQGLFWLPNETVCWFAHNDKDRASLKFPHRVTLWKPRGEKLNLPPQEILG